MAREIVGLDRMAGLRPRPAHANTRWVVPCARTPWIVRFFGTNVPVECGGFVLD